MLMGRDFRLARRSTVPGGRVLALYLLPEGSIEFTRDPQTGYTSGENDE